MPAGTAVAGRRLDFRSLVGQFQYWNSRRRRPAGFSFSGNTTVVLERPSPASGWIFVPWYNCSTGTAVAGGRLDFRSQEWSSPAAGWISFSGSTTVTVTGMAVAHGRLDFVLWQYKFSTGTPVAGSRNFHCLVATQVLETAGAGGWIFRSLVVQL